MPGHIPILVVVGDGGVGKTSIIVRYTTNKFKEGYEPTLEDHYKCSIPIEHGPPITIEIADTAGQEEYKLLRDKYIADGDIFIVVYSIIDSRSLQAASDLLEDISLFKENQNFKAVICGNKCDMESMRQVSRNDGQQLAHKYKGIFLETSALSKKNIDETFQNIARFLQQDDDDGPKCCEII